MKKKTLIVYLPTGGGLADTYETGKDDVENIDLLNNGTVSVRFRKLENGNTVWKDRVYSGMPFILSDV